MLYRSLTDAEIIALEEQNCRAIDGWKQIEVSHNFVTSHIHNVTFSGKNFLGEFSEKITLPSGAIDMAGLYNVHLHNCTLQHQCYIKNIGTAISNYIIDEAVIIQNTGSLCCEEDSSFGNGVEVSPVNEAGGREVLIYDDLSAHTAYLMTFYRHRPQLIEALKKSIHVKIASITSSHGYIGKNSTIINCGNIKNIKTGSHAHLEGVHHLSNGSINSSTDSPTYIGHGVNASNFIISSGSTVSEGAHLTNCFVGQGCEIANSYTADNSLFFANSQCLQGEACSIFAGPYTVTHHKSTLLIAGYYSFFNAGSGTNQSNHMYKLGPVHQGIIERGGRTGSYSYILWPAHIGAFTMVLGSHYSNPNISTLPFSYLIEDDGKSVLMPGQNIFNVGTTRDANKWPKRDKRKGNKHLDYIISEVLNPYTINKITDGLKVLKELQEKATPQAKHLMYKNTQLSLAAISRGFKLYEQALLKYVGDVLVDALKQSNIKSIRNSFMADNHQWIDLSGLICNTTSLEKFLADIEQYKIDINQWNSFYQHQFNHYISLKQNHALTLLKNYFNIDILTCTSNDLAHFIEGWIENNSKIKSTIVMDAKKEFNIKSKIGFGIDGDEECGNLDFEAVRGNVSDNPFILDLEHEYENKNKQALKIINKLNN